MPEIDATGTDYAQYSWSRYQVSHGIVVIGLIYACFNRDDEIGTGFAYFS